MVDNEKALDEGLNSSSLNKKKDTLWPDRFPDSDELALRTHRAISWIDRAEQETADHDAAFIFYWIAFNAAYAQDIQGIDELGERDRLRQYFNHLLILDPEGRIFDAVWDMFSD